MGRYRKYWLVVGVALIQGYFLPAVSATVIPNLLLVLVIYAGLHADLEENLKFALWSGFWLDLVSSTQFGFRTIWFSLLVVLLWWLKKVGVKTNNYGWIAIIVLASSWFYNLSLGLLLWFEGGNLAMIFNFTIRWLFEAVITTSLALMVQHRLRLAWPQSKRLYEV